LVVINSSPLFCNLDCQSSVAFCVDLRYFSAAVAQDHLRGFKAMFSPNFGRRIMPEPIGRPHGHIGLPACTLYSPAIGIRRVSIADNALRLPVSRQLVFSLGA